MLSSYMKSNLSTFIRGTVMKKILPSEITPENIYRNGAKVTL